MPAARLSAPQHCAKNPASNSVAATPVYRVAHTSGDHEYADLAEAQAALAARPGARLFICRKPADNRS